MIHKYFLTFSILSGIDSMLILRKTSEAGAENWNVSSTFSFPYQKDWRTLMDIIWRIKTIVEMVNLVHGLT